MNNNPMLTHEQLQRETDYRIALCIAQRLRKEVILTEAELRKAERKLAKEFPPVWAGNADKSRL